MKILLVEDNAVNRDMLSRHLIRRGFEVVFAIDGAVVQATAEEERPDLILMDGHLPQLSGWEATRRLRAAPGTRHIPVIALTAGPTAVDRAEALAAGCDDYDSKPVDVARLLGKIHALLKSAP